jgi:hypothetical protein
MSSTNAPLTVEARDEGPLDNIGKNEGVRLGPVSGSVDQSKVLVPSESMADEPSLSPNVSCDTEPSVTYYAEIYIYSFFTAIRAPSFLHIYTNIHYIPLPQLVQAVTPSQPHGMFTSWTLVAQSQEHVLFPGDRLWVAIECSARLEGKFVFTFETNLATYDSDATMVFLRTRTIERSQHLHELSCKIPVPQRIGYYHRDVTVKICPALGKGQGQVFPCKDIRIF